MSRTYHANAKTIIHIRQEIYKSYSSNTILAQQYGVSTNTITKWRKRDFQRDVTSRPHSINYSLTDTTEALICPIRKCTWESRESITDMLASKNIKVSAVTVYRCFVKHGFNKKPKTVRATYSKFKEY